MSAPAPLPTHEAAPQASPEATAFYAESLGELSRSGIPFLLAGTYALTAYTGIRRPTKDLDVFCRAGDLPRVLAHFQRLGWQVEVEDERWIGKVRRGDLFFDVIFASANGTMPVNDLWFEHAGRTTAFDVDVAIVSPTELIWSKSLIQLRHRFDGPDIMHVILRQHATIDWHRLLGHMEQYWEILLAHLLNFRWIYPAQRDHVPRWLMDELLDRLRRQIEVPASQQNLCRGPMLSRFDYAIDVAEWGFQEQATEADLRND